MIDVNIRRAVADDLAQVLRLYAQPGFDDGEVLPDAGARALFARFSEYPDYGLYVAVRDGEIIGTFALLVMINLGHMGAPSAIVEEVVVAPAWQGRGIGKDMMRRAMDLAREKGCYKLVLSSNEKRVAARAFYEKLGFRRHGLSFHAVFGPG